MIYSLLFEDLFVNLVPLATRDGSLPNPYKVDSMTLVVGPNDSGKTRLLSKISHVIASGSGQAESDTDLGNIGVIYYSPAPFDKKRFPSNRSKRVAIRSSESDRSLQNVEILEELKRDFGFNASIKLKLKETPGDGISLLLSLAMEIPQRIGNFSELSNSLSSYQKASHDWRKNPESTEDISQYQSEVIRCQQLLKRDIINLVGKKLGQRTDQYLIALALTHRYGSNKKRHILEFWSLLEGQSEGGGLLDMLGRLQGLAHYYDITSLIEGIEIDGSLDLEGAKEFPEIASIQIDGLSSGAEALVRQFTTLHIAIDELMERSSLESIVVLIDEGDAFLHLAWQQRYVLYLDRFLASRRPASTSIQVVVATHSPVLMSDFPRDHIIRPHQNNGGLEEVVSFAAPLERIVEATAGAGSIGKFAEQVIGEQIRLGHNASEQLIGRVDDLLLRDYLLKKRVGNVG